jgi:hypothetical protein
MHLSVFIGGMIMKTLFGAVAGALVLGAVLVSYDLGERHTFSRDAMATQMVIGPDGVARPYAVPVSQAAYGQTPFAAQPYGWSPYGATMMPGAVSPAAVAPYGVYGAQPQFASQPAVYSQPAVRRVATQRTYTTERASRPARSWQKSALLIGGSAGAGAGVGALIGGKKGAGIGALIGGGSAALLDYSKRH